MFAISSQPCVCVCRSIRVQFRLDASLVREVDGNFTRVSAYFGLNRLLLTKHKTLISMQSSTTSTISQTTLTVGGSGFGLHRFTRFVVSTVKYRPLVGNSFIPTPTWLKKKHCSLNIENFHDDSWVKYCILASLFNAKDHPERVSQYKRYENVLNFDNIRFPVQPSDIARFEQQKSHISVVFSYDSESKGFCIVYLSRDVGRPTTLTCYCQKKKHPLSDITCQQKICRVWYLTDLNTVERRSFVIAVFIRFPTVKRSTIIFRSAFNNPRSRKSKRLRAKVHSI